MKTINLYPPHIDTAPIIDGEKWPLNETREVFKILDSGKQKLVGVVGNGCTMCSRAKKREADAIVKPRLMRGKHPEQGRVLCVFSYLSFGVTVDHMVDLIRRVGFEGDLLIDIPIRCGTGATTESQMTRCSPYLRMSYHQFKPDRILCFGANASKSVLGISVPAWVNRWCWTAIPEEVATEDQYVSNRRIPVVSLMDPIAYNRSRVHREIIDSEVEWALKADFPDHRPVGMAYIVEGVEDLPAVERWVERVRQTTGWIAYDVETNGVMHNPDFSIIMCSVAATSIPHVLLWDKQALDNPALMERLVQLLTDPTISKRGQNEKYDALSWLTWKGVTVAPVDGDCRLEMKLANADSKADLESLGFYVGVNAHKTEAKEWMQQAILSAKEDLDPDIEGVNAKAYAYKYLPSEVLSRYNALDTKVTAAVCQHARGLLGPLEKTLHRLVLPASELFKRIEYKGMAVDVNGIEAARQYLETEIASLAPRFEREGLDPDKPDTIRVWLENMGIDSPIKTDKGLASTNAKALKLVESKNELIAAILRHRKLAKLLSSYADTLPGYIRADGRVHPSFLLDGARSGRLSCTSPALQTIPSRGEMAKLIKNCFVATKGYKLVCLDFAILEIRIAAVLSGDPDMAVAAQGDFHTETAKALAQLAWNTTPEAVEAEIKGGNKSKRDTAKTLGFAILYGAGPHSIAESVGCSVPAAERLITGFLTKYKKLKAWMRDQVQFARDNACVDIPWLDGTIGRRRPLLNIHSADNGERGNAERGAVNSPIQSLASDICLSSAVKIDEWYRANSIPASIVCLVHDSIISEVREDFVDEVTRTKAHLMTSWPTGPVPLKVEAEVGYAWGSLQKVSV